MSKILYLILVRDEEAVQSNQDADSYVSSKLKPMQCKGKYTTNAVSKSESKESEIDHFKPAAHCELKQSESQDSIFAKKPNDPR